ncbi:WD40-repeat-containing domain protein [Mycotypha africana]|uniref:WD40-repeat-containing domain protein n=1 Tax=Mycotypha africana TaxID=64632 RepID=UPI002300448E|nr:WD40-repeat-containing domain protein [Mycotypha africana]KAI8984769.1 WD40-repeat-containing domain protein [Mycotypha africana]
MIKWIPDSEDLFMASFDDGSVLILDKEKEDQAYTLPQPQTWAEEHLQITKPDKGSKYNPVAHWQVSHKGISAFSFSPDGRHIAMVGKDGLMRVIDYADERLCDVFVGYFGRMLCVTWSPDGRYILTGGQDDIVTIWSFTENKIIARCRGHRSWVTGVAFDPLQCDDKNYRFGSVGEDCKLLLWDFSMNALHRPKHKPGKPAISTHEMNSRNVLPLRDSFVKRDSYSTISSSGTIAAPTIPNSSPLMARRFRKRASIFGNNMPNELTTLQPIDHVRLPTIHPALSKGQVPYLQPIVKSTVHSDPCVDIVFRKDTIVTTDRRGRIRVWSRPTT